MDGGPSQPFAICKNSGRSATRRRRTKKGETRIKSDPQRPLLHDADLPNSISPAPVHVAQLTLLGSYFDVSGQAASYGMFDFRLLTQGPSCGGVLGEADWDVSDGHFAPRGGY